MTQFVKVAAAGEIAPGKVKAVVVGEHEIAVVNFDGQLYAVSNLCTHAMCTLTYGFVEHGSIICSCHWAEFELATGIALGPRGLPPLTPYPVQITGDDVEVGIP
jgi:3-phenylpropionate/trans-cinnamate dioxygenase ferredoxin subunit